MGNYWVRVENNQVVECLTYNPNKEGDWREAIDVIPSIIEGKQIISGHYFDVSKTPVEIIWNIHDLTVEERKETLLQKLISQNLQIVSQEIEKELNCSCSNSESCCLDTLTSNIQIIRQNKATINSLNTHQEIDDYINNNQTI